MTSCQRVLRPNLRWRWLLTAAFGLVHGFGFSFVLTRQLQFAGDHLLLSLLAFNVGIELGQLLFIAVAIPLLALLFAWARSAGRLITIVISAFVAHTKKLRIGDGMGISEIGPLVSEPARA